MDLRRKTILFTCAEFGGGIGKMLRFVIAECVPIFACVSLLHRGRASSNDIPPEEVKEFEIPSFSIRNALLWRWKQISEIRRNIININPDIVCCFGTEQAVMVALAMVGLNGIKLIQCDRGDPYTQPLVWRPLAKWAFKRADNCVFQLEKQGRWYGKTVMKRSAVIPNAFIPTGTLLPNVGERKKTIVSVGRFVYEKRYEVLLEAFNDIHKKHPEYKLVLYGEGPYRKRYERMIRQYSLEAYVDMPGYTNDSMNVIRDAGVFVLPSLYEGIPNTLIEALAIGVPTVSTDCTPGGPDFLTDHGRRGLIVPVNDSKAMADAVCKIIEDPVLASQLSQRGQEVISLLDKDRISNLWIDFFESVI